jgi:hypothetical protein
VYTLLVVGGKVSVDNEVDGADGSDWGGDATGIDGVVAEPKWNIYKLFKFIPESILTVNPLSSFGEDVVECIDVCVVVDRGTVAVGEGCPDDFGESNEAAFNVPFYTTISR